MLECRVVLRSIRNLARPEFAVPLGIRGPAQGAATPVVDVAVARCWGGMVPKPRTCAAPSSPAGGAAHEAHTAPTGDVEAVWATDDLPDSTARVNTPT